MLYYVILPLNEVTALQLNSAIENDITKLRLSLDGIYTTLKFRDIEDKIPNEFKDFTLYTHEEILEIMSTSEWSQID